MARRRKQSHSECTYPAPASASSSTASDTQSVTEFFVHGTPTTQGSKSLMRVRGRVMMIETSKGLHAWRSAVASAAVQAGTKISEGDVWVDITAYWVRPQCHVTADGSPRKSCPARPRYADCDKLARAICDALAGIAYRNDRQVAVLSVRREWCNPSYAVGALIKITNL